MNLYSVAYILSLLLFGNVLFQLLPIMVALIFGEVSLLPQLFISMGISLVFPVLLMMAGIPSIVSGNKMKIGHRESFLIVAGAWFFLALTGAFPYFITGAIPAFTDAFFESISGYTTTGASILTNIEQMPKALLFWRSFTHWIGGMGIIVFTLALLPALGIGGVEMFKAEVPGPIPDKLAPQIKQTAKILWKLYLVFTIAQILLLKMAGMDWFEAVNHSFATLATGGYSTKNVSIAAYGPLIQWMITFFMIVAGVNFSLHYRFFKGDWKAYWQDAEFRFYIKIMGSGALLITIYIFFYQFFTYSSVAEGNSIGSLLRHSLFQVSSLVTTTGFATADYEKWPYFAQVILFILMFFGGSAGSTGGGIKQIRILVLIKVSLDEIRRLIHPRALFNANINDRPLSMDVQKSIVSFIIIYIFILATSTAIISLWDIDLMTSMTAALATLGNIGPGLGLVGPTDNYAWFPAPVKWLLSFLMIMGRLEIFPILIILSPGIWER